MASGLDKEATGSAGLGLGLSQSHGWSERGLPTGAGQLGGPSSIQAPHFSPLRWWSLSDSRTLPGDPSPGEGPGSSFKPPFVLDSAFLSERAGVPKHPSRELYRFRCCSRRALP